MALALVRPFTIQELGSTTWLQRHEIGTSVFTGVGERTREGTDLFLR